MALRALVSALGFILGAVLACGCGPTMPSAYAPPLPRTASAKPFAHPTGIKFVKLPVGWVESRISDIQLRRAVLISAHEITNAQYEKFAPAHKRSKTSPGDKHPVNNVTASKAEAFCNWLTENDSVGRKYKLPDEVEWEYAARGGHDYKTYPWGNSIDKTKACYQAKGAEPVGSYPPNDFGLYDVVGNVAEWVVTDDIPPHAVRGGAWCDDPDALRIAARAETPDEDDTLDHHGFRVLCEPPIMGTNR